MQNTKSAPIKLRAFLAAFAVCGTIKGACRAARVARSSAYRWKSDSRYAEEFALARRMAADALQDIAVELARDGRQRLVTEASGRPVLMPLTDEAGEVVTDAAGKPLMVGLVEREYSDLLLIFLLKGNRPDKFREFSEQRVLHAGTVNGSGVMLLSRPNFLRK